MIEVYYHRADNRLTMRGHAGSGKFGEDIVCAAASILAYTMASNVDSAFANRLCICKQCKLEPGDTDISCKPYPESRAMVTLIMDSVCAGFSLLAANYPEYVSYHVASPGDSGGQA